MRVEHSSGLDIGVFEAVLALGSADKRMALAKQLAKFVADPATPQFERDQVMPVMVKISVDPEISVRKALAIAVENVKELHADLLFSIIADEDRVAIPFLCVTPALTPRHMLAVLRVGDDARQDAVAGRPDITAEAKAYVVKAGGIAAAMALVTNKDARLTADDLKQIYQRLGRSGELAEKLLARPDLPPDIRIIHAKRSAVLMRQMMAEKGWLAANDASMVTADAEELAVLDVLVSAAAREREMATAFLAAQGMLTPSLIMRAACLGHMEVVTVALAHLTGNGVGRVRDLIVTRGGSGIKNIVNRSGLPANAHALLSAAAEVESEKQTEGVNLDADSFGRRLLENLMTRFGALHPREQAKQIDYVGRFADDKVRKIARQLRADIQRAA